MRWSDDRARSSEDALLALLADPEAVIKRLDAAIAHAVPRKAKQLQRQLDELRTIFPASAQTRRALG